MVERHVTSKVTRFDRPAPNAVSYDISKPDVVTITVPVGSIWTSGPHWHEAHTEYLQILNGNALVTLEGISREVSTQRGVVEIKRGAVHEWQRVPNADDCEDLVVREWTAPADGQKEAFFRMLNSFLMEESPEEMHWPLPALLNNVLEPWVVTIQLWIIFRTWDNWPVMVGNGKGLVNWVVTHGILMVGSWIGSLVGLRGIYEEYLSKALIRRATDKA